MTEKEAILELKFFRMKLYALDNGRYASDTGVFDVAIATFKEIQRYRELGTVENLRDLLDKLKKYEAIGTVEELQEAMERQRAKKPTSNDCYNWECPTCGAYHSTIGDYCSDCGQAIDWD